MWGEDDFSLGSTSAADISSSFAYACLSAATFIHMASILEFFEFGLEKVLFLQTLRTAHGDVFRIFTGVIPVFLAYATFGTVVYGDRLDRFGDLASSSMTLFAVLVGDEVRPTFMALKSDNAVDTIVLGFFLGSFVVSLSHSSCRLCLQSSKTR